MARSTKTFLVERKVPSRCCSPVNHLSLRDSARSIVSEQQDKSASLGCECFHAVSCETKIRPRGKLARARARERRRNDGLFGNRNSIEKLGRRVVLQWGGKHAGGCFYSAEKYPRGREKKQGTIWEKRRDRRGFSRFHSEEKSLSLLPHRREGCVGEHPRSRPGSLAAVSRERAIGPRNRNRQRHRHRHTSSRSR